MAKGEGRHEKNLVIENGCYKKDYPDCVLSAFNPSVYTIVCIDPPGYGTSRPPDRLRFII
uniref:Alpha/beta hydrolase n=1 Tax=Ascaris lumbricoides TaxID=6252 RepID=A0A0M3IXC1_ASCLU